MKTKFEVIEGYNTHLPNPEKKIVHGATLAGIIILWVVEKSCRVYFLLEEKPIFNRHRHNMHMKLLLPSTAIKMNAHLPLPIWGAEPKVLQRVWKCDDTTMI